MFDVRFTLFGQLHTDGGIPASPKNPITVQFLSGLGYRG